MLIRRSYSFTSTLVLLAFALAIHTAYPLIEVIYLECIKKSQHELIENKEAVHLFETETISKQYFDENYTWWEKEIVLGSEYYEVINYTVTGNDVICTLLSDKKETELRKNIAQHSQQETGTRKIKLRLYWWPLLYTESRDIINERNYASTCKITFKSLTTILLKGFTLAQIDPPDTYRPAS